MTRSLVFSPSLILMFTMVCDIICNDITTVNILSGTQ